MNLSKTQISKLTQLGIFLERHLDLLMKVSLQLTKNIIKPLAKSILIPLGLTTAAADTESHEELFLREPKL